MGNGKGEGSLYIGRGVLQLTGKSNYRSFASDMELPEIMTDPELVSSNYAFETALWLDRKSTRLNSSHSQQSRMPSSA